MADDPIKAFRDRFTPRSTAAPAPSSPSTATRLSTGETYEPFGTKDKVTRLDIRCADGLAHAVPYGYLLNVTYNRRTYAEIFLTVSGLTVTVKGRNLRPIVDALKLHTCEFIQQFAADEFAQSSDPAAPLIESIVVEVMRGGAAGSGTKSAA